MDKDKVIIEQLKNIYSIIQNLDDCANSADYHILMDKIYSEMDKLEILRK